MNEPKTIEEMEAAGWVCHAPACGAGDRGCAWPSCMGPYPEDEPPATETPVKES